MVPSWAIPAGIGVVVVLALRVSEALEPYRWRRYERRLQRQREPLTRAESRSAPVGKEVGVGVPVGSKGLKNRRPTEFGFMRVPGGR